MPILPVSSASTLVRTDFTDDPAWQRACDEALRENEYGFRAYVQPVSDPAFDGLTYEAVQQAVPVDDHSAHVLFIADALALAGPDHPILVVGLASNAGKPLFRCIATELWSVDNNLNIANMDWEDFTAASDESNVFRGFPT